MVELGYWPSVFGEIRILERKSDSARLYMIGDSLQSMATPGGISYFGHLHAIHQFTRGRREVLLLGGAGGCLGSMLAREGHHVTIVDIDPFAEDIARRYFNCPLSIEWIKGDALRYLTICERSFDAIIIDACDADGLVKDFKHADRLCNTMRLLTPDGVLMVNLVGDIILCASRKTLAREMATQGFYAELWFCKDSDEANEILLVSKKKPRQQLKFILNNPSVGVERYITGLRMHRL
jgi:spermidine synthase